MDHNPTPLRETARHLFLATLDRLRIENAFERHIHSADGVLQAGGARYPVREFHRIKLVSVGKAAVPMARALVATLRTQLAPVQMLDGITIGPKAAQDPHLRSYIGGHPIPDRHSLDAGAAVLRYLSGSDAGCLVFFLISGGASTMMEQPLDPSMTDEDTAAFHRVLVHSGLSIDQMNTLRKHFSAVKGGRLAVATAPATQCTLLVSDVPRGALHIIGSGPTLPDPSTIADCRALLAAHERALPFPEKILRFFASETLPETPKPEDPAFMRTSSCSVLSSDDACAEASRLAQAQGFHVVVDNRCDDWPYDDAAQHLLDRIRALRRSHRRVCLLSAGEISVQVGAGKGTGGRNQHFVLECARRLAIDGGHVTILSAGTDGIDGNSPAAGAVADETTVSRAADRGFDVDTALAHFDSNTVLHALGDTVITGPSGNNVRDLRILLSVD